MRIAPHARPAARTPPVAPRAAAPAPAAPAGPTATAATVDARESGLVVRARRNVLRRRALMAARVGSTTIGAALNSSVRVRFEGSGPFSSRRIVGETDFTNSLLRHPRIGPLLLRFLRGVLTHLDGEESTARLSGMSFSTTELGATVNRFLTMMSISDFPRMVPSATDAELLHTFRQTRAASSASTAATYFHTREGGWIDLGSIASALPFILVGATKTHKQSDAKVTASMTQLLYMLHHELEHARTPDGKPTLSLRRYVGEGTRLSWLEEGTADVLSTWGSDLAGFGANLGVTEPVRAAMPAAPTPAYAGRYRVVRALLVAAGLNLDVAADAATARHLLQGHALADVPRALADAIVAARKLRPDQAAALAARIAATEGKPAKLAALQREFGLVAAAAGTSAPASTAPAAGTTRSRGANTL